MHGMPWFSGTGLLLLLLLASRLAFLVDGAVGSLHEKGSGDLHGRYAEFQWVRSGQDPYPALERLRVEKRAESTATTAGADPAPELPGLDEIAVGDFADGDWSRVNPWLDHYPPWSYVLLAPLLIVPWPATVWLLLALNAFAFAYVLIWARSLLNGWWGWLAVFAVLLPMHSWSVGVAVGQLSILVMAVQVVLLRALASSRTTAAAVALSWLAVKPTSSALFGWCLLLPFLQRRASSRFVLRAMAGVVAMVGLATAAVWAWTGTAPWIWVSQVHGNHRSSLDEGYGLLTLFVGLLDRMGAAGLPAAGRIALLAALLGVLAQGAAVWWFRGASLLVHFAIAGWISRFWAYHRHYDDVLLVFLFVALVVECRRGSWLCGLALLGLASAFGAPTPSGDTMVLWRVGVSFLSLVVLLAEHRSCDHPLGENGESGSVVLDGQHQVAVKSTATG